MLYKFIANCRCALNGESADYRELLKDFNFNGRKSCVIGFMPAVTDDLFPVLPSPVQAQAKSSRPIFTLFPLVQMITGQSLSLKKSSTDSISSMSFKSSLISSLKKCFYLSTLS